MWREILRVIGGTVNVARNIAGNRTDCKSFPNSCSVTLRILNFPNVCQLCHLPTCNDM